jgi:pimeloyl-ACP methyl ester carboxylesterase
MPRVDVSGRALHYLRRGSGEPLLLIQGMSGTHRAWGEAFLAPLEPVFDCIIYDHRGVGLSARVDEEFTLVELAQDAAGLLSALGVERAHVLGISMGGMVAQELALGHPDRIRSLVLGCTYCGGPGARLTDPAVGARLFEALQSRDYERLLRVGWELNLSEGFRSDPSRFAAFREMSTALPAPLPVTMLQAKAALAHDTSARLPSLTAPTLVIHGTEDRMLDVSNGRMIASLIPGARPELLDGVGHMFWWERPERSAALVRDHALAHTR